MSSVVLQAGRWYVDGDTGQRFQVLDVGARTVRVVDQDGNERTLNRLICEWQLRLEAYVTQMLAENKEGYPCKRAG